MSVEWPFEPVSLSRCAELFSAAGEEVDRTNLGRYIADRGYPFTEGERGAKLVDAKALWEIWSNDFNRRVMSGQDPALDAEQGDASAGGGASGSASPAAAPQQAEKSDPKRELATLKVQGEHLVLAERLGRVVPVEEVAAAQAEAIAELDAAMRQAVSDIADELLQALHLPAHHRRTIAEALKKVPRRGRELFAARMALLLQVQGDPQSAARARLDALVAHDLKLRAAGDTVARELERQD